MRFRLPQKNKLKPKNRLELIRWRWRQPKLRFDCCFATYAFICPFCFAKDGLCGFDYRKKINPNRKIGLSLFGGDGGNRNRVRKSIPATFYEHSLSFKIPLKERRQTGFLLRYPLGHDEMQGYSFIHVHC